MTHPEEHKKQGPVEKADAPIEQLLPPHVREFERLLLAHDAAVRARNKLQAAQIERELEQFYGRLPASQQDDLRTFVRQRIAGKVIEDERGRIHSGVARALHWAPRAVRMIADVFPQLCQETVRLALTTVGLTLVGVGQALKTTLGALKRAFFGKKAA